MALIDELTETAAELERMQTPQDRSRLASWKYISNEAFVLGEGRPFVSQPLTKEERAVLDEPLELFRFVRKKFEFQQCYSNSQMMLQFDFSNRLRYAEGFILDPRGLGAALHSWLVLNDKVIDFTGPPSLPLPDEPPQLLGEFEPREYFGVIFPRAQVLRRYGFAKEEWGSLIDDPVLGDPLQRYGRTGRPRRVSATQPGRRAAR